MRSRSKPMSTKELKARRENAKKSTGPRTEMGKARVSANALKHGYHADKIAYQAMIALGEDPEEFAFIYNTLVQSEAPQNGEQFLLLEDVAVMKWQANRNQRGQAGLIGKAQEALVRERMKKFKDYEQTLEDAPQEQVIAHGIASLPDSGGKFERIVDLLRIMIGTVEKGEYRDAASTLRMVYGKEDESLHVATQRRRLEHLATGVQGLTAKDAKKWVLEDLAKDRQRWSQAWKEHLETMRGPTQAELNACCVPQGKAWRAAIRQAASLDQRIDKKMRLYWEAQKKDRERIVRQYEEAKLEATPEEVAAEQEAKEFTAKLGALIQGMDAKLKAEAETRQATAAGETEAEVVGEPSHSAADNKTTASTDGQRPASRAASAPSGSSAEASADLSEQSEELVENKEAGSENKPETKLSPGD